MDRIYTILIFLAVPILGYSQLFCPPIDGKKNQNKNIEITAGGGFTMLYGDINHTNNFGYGAVLKGDYHIIKGLFAGLELQTGLLKSRGESNIYIVDWDPRFVENQYFAGSLNVTAYPYRFFTDEKFLFKKSFFERNILYGFYVGLGVGGIFNNYKNIQRQTSYSYRDLNTGATEVMEIPEGSVNGAHENVFVYDADGEMVLDADGNPVTTKLYSQKTRDKLLPIVNVGLSIPLNKFSTRTDGYFSLVINSQFNFSGGEDLDGYNPINTDGSRPEGARNDMYNFSYLGIKYSF
ncbi:hypothetical protein [Sphingobacterium hungaricum]|uniref:Uncharacterized protein n=1 Tax=Sphingobacterium hungaricum TaxID=2082723 RepID=A0A928UX72_9SPHI|nr:hypothetical protein [Sphingobacterium hungaricum]MBE8714946.1 hypothetical protein [Sphingobacterium hungaricum]